MAKPFERSAEYYDSFAFSYGDTTAEIEFLEHCFESFCKRTIHDILDNGCGTGMYSLPIAQKGYRVVGIDISQNMVQVAERKAKEMSADVQFLCQDMRKLTYQNEFDAVICMNSTFNYILTNADVMATLTGFHRALRPNGIVFIDLFNFLTYFKEPFPVSFQMIDTEQPGMSIVQNIGIDGSDGFYKMRRLGMVDTKSRMDCYNEDFTYRVFTQPEMVTLFKQTGFKDIHCFASTLPGGVTKPVRLVFVGKKT